MAKKPTTIAAYIASAPSEAQPHLRKVHAILKSVAPRAEQTIKWNNPFFVEPRFLFAFSATKKHCNFAPSPETLQAFGDELADHKTTKYYLQLPYTQPMPEKLIRKLAKHQLKRVHDRDDDNFW